MNEHEPTPDALSVAVQSVVAPELKTTVPPSWPAPVTVAVKRSDCPSVGFAGLAEKLPLAAALVIVKVPLADPV